MSDDDAPLIHRATIPLLTNMRDISRAWRDTLIDQRRGAPAGYAIDTVARPGVPSVAPFDPSVLNLSLFARSYSGGNWAGTASAGGSGSVTLTDNGTVGTSSLNGFGVADLNGSSHRFSHASAMSTFITSTNFSGWALINPDILSSAGAAWSQNDAIVATSGTGQFGIFMKSDNTIGVGVFVNEAGPGDRTVTSVIGTGAYSLMQFRGNGTNIYIRNSSGSWQSAAGGTINSLAASLDIGRSPSGVEWFDGKLAEIALSPDFFDDATFNNVLAYVNSRYNLAL